MTMTRARTMTKTKTKTKTNDQDQDPSHEEKSIFEIFTQTQKKMIFLFAIINKSCLILSAKMIERTTLCSIMSHKGLIMTRWLSSMDAVKVIAYFLVKGGSVAISGF
jgi:hypothetical protein